MQKVTLLHFSGRRLALAYPLQVDEEADDTSTGVVDMRDFDEVQRRFRRDSELNWSRRGWSGIGWRGRYVGCPESPDGSKPTLYGIFAQS